MSATSTPRRRPGYPGSLTDLHRFRKSVHGHDGSSRIVMIRKTDQRTFALRNGQGPKLETITRETIETFRGPRSACKITTEKKDYEVKVPLELYEFNRSDRSNNIRKTPTKVRYSTMTFQEECLKAHNFYRQKHGVPPLKLNKNMCRISQEWAEQLIKKGTLTHSNNKEYGENIFCLTSSNPSDTIKGDRAVESWYAEITKHIFGIEPKGLSTGHFTQVVWKTSRELGVGYAKSGGKMIVVANYFPPGNYIGSFTENVPPVVAFNDSGPDEDPLVGGLKKLSVTSHKPDKCGTDGNFEQDFLEAHNKYRALHGVPPLKLDKKLCKYCEEWAKHIAQKGVLEHRPNCNYGENIFSIWASDPSHKITGEVPVKSWYSEAENHKYGKEPRDLQTGHFTQVIWKESEFIGVGVAKNQNRIYVVANYSPAGNFVGHYVENVPPPIKGNKLSPVVKKDLDTTLDSEIETCGSFSSFALEALKAHNDYRRKHGVPELILNKEMCRYSQEWADICAKNGSMTHRANNKYGENIFYFYSSDPSYELKAIEPVKVWYDEVKAHDFGIETVNRSTLHFSQVVWKKSTELGIGMARNKKGETYVVANYNPKGNFIGEFVENVPRPKS